MFYSIRAVGAQYWGFWLNTIFCVYVHTAFTQRHSLLKGLQCSLWVERDRNTERERKKTQSKIKKLLWPYANTRMLRIKIFKKTFCLCKKNCAYLSLKIETSETFTSTVFIFFFSEKTKTITLTTIKAKMNKQIKNEKKKNIYEKIELQNSTSELHGIYNKIKHETCILYMHCVWFSLA